MNTSFYTLPLANLDRETILLIMADARSRIDGCAGSEGEYEDYIAKQTHIIQTCSNELTRRFLDEPILTCIGCNKQPQELSEYVDAAREEGMTPTQYVRSDEGTLHKFERNKFYCTTCYIKAGMPLNPKHPRR